MRQGKYFTLSLAEGISAEAAREEVERIARDVLTILSLRNIPTDRGVERLLLRSQGEARALLSPRIPVSQVLGFCENCWGAIFIFQWVRAKTQFPSGIFEKNSVRFDFLLHNSFHCNQLTHLSSSKIRTFL